MASAGLAALAAVVLDLPADVRKLRVAPAMKALWSRHSATLPPELQLALATHFAVLLEGLAPALEGEHDMAAALACFRSVLWIS